VNLANLLGVGERELVAFTGAGGKSTLLLALGNELASQGQRVVLTTTTKLGPDQLSGTVCWSPEPAEVERALAGPGPVFVVGSDQGHKVEGVSPEAVNALYAETSADYVLVEADGARRRPLKAPAAHEPVVPTEATLVVVLAGINAVGQTLGDAVHRPPQGTALTGLGESDLLRPQDIATVLGHSDGGLKGIPERARVVVALTRVDAETADAAAEIEDRLAGNTRFERVVVIPASL
jgi:molybdenum cofactor cytidylyltransferase